MNLRKVAAGTALALTLATGFIAPWEGKHNKAYLDIVQVPTICYGHTRNVRLGDIKTDTECTALLKAEVERIDNLITKNVKVSLRDRERAALISFAYNVGDGALLRSTALKRFNMGDHVGGCNSLATKSFNAAGVCSGYGCGWAGGKMVRGLQNRRIAEKQMCLGETQ